MEITQRLRGGAVGRSRFRLASLGVSARWIAPHLTIGVTAAALGVIALGLGHFTAFYSIDGDVKYLAALNIAHHFPNAAIPYPSVSLDPGGRYSLPLTAWYSGHQYAGYSLPFLYIAGAAIALWGNAGVIVPPILGTVILLYAQLRLANSLGLKTNRLLLALLTVVATPILFYSVSFWEHTWGVGLLLAGVALIIPSTPSRRLAVTTAAASGLLFAAAIMMRRDTLLPVLVCLCVLPLVFRRRDVLMACTVAGVVCAIPLGAIVLFHPEPLALGITHASPGRGAIGIRKSLTRLDKVEFLFDGGWATALLMTVAAAAAVAGWLKPKLVTPIIALGAVAAGLLLAGVMLNPYLVSNENVFAFCPIAIWGLLLPLIKRSGRREGASTTAPELKLWVMGRMDLIAGHGAEATIWLLAVVGPLAVGLAEYDSGGAQWGPRYLLFAFPLFILLALKARERMLELTGPSRNARLVNYSFVTLIGLSVLLQGFGLFALSIQKGLSATAQAAVSRTHTDTVVSASPVIDTLAPTYSSNRYLYAPTQNDLTGLMAYLRQDGTHRLVMMCDPLKPCVWNGYRGWQHGRIRIVDQKIGLAIFTDR